MSKRVRSASQTSAISNLKVHKVISNYFYTDASSSCKYCKALRNTLLLNYLKLTFDISRLSLITNLQIVCMR